MKHASVDLEKLRVALQRMSRGNLLMVAERAIEIVPRAKLSTLVGDMVRLDQLTEGKRGAAPLLEEVRKFHDASLRGEYYDSFDVNSKNFMDKSEGTEAFIAEFDRLVGKCVRASEKGSHGPVREAFELLFALLRRIDEDPDSVVFFAEEAGAWHVGVDWREVLPAYFRCLADATPGEDFAREVDRAISDFDDYDRARHLTAARRVANAEQKTALRRLPARDRTQTPHMAGDDLSTRTKQKTAEQREARGAGPSKPKDADAPAMHLAEAVRDIIDIIRDQRAAGEASDGWNHIVRTVAENDSLPDSQVKVIEGAIAEAYRGWSDAQRRSIWYETDSGMTDDDDDDLCDTSFNGIGYALQVEMLDEVTHAAWRDAAELKRARPSPRPRG